MAEEKREKNAAEDELDAPARALIRQEEVEVDLEAQRQIRRRTFSEMATAFFVELVNGSAAGVRSPVTSLLLLVGLTFMFIYEYFRESSFLASVKRVVCKDAKDDGKIN